MNKKFVIFLIVFTVVMFSIICSLIVSGMISISANYESDIASHTPKPILIFTNTPSPPTSKTNLEYISSTSTSTASLTATVKSTYTLTPTITNTPNPIQNIIDRINDNYFSRAWGDFNNFTINLIEDTLVIESITSHHNLSVDAYYLEEDIADLLVLVLIDCSRYSVGKGIEGCEIIKDAIYDTVEIYFYPIDYEGPVYVKYIVGKKDYFSGYYGDQIAGSKVFELAEEYSFKYTNRPFDIWGNP
jgi:hypothetical protein